MRRPASCACRMSVRECRAHQVGAVLADLDGGEVCPALDGERAEDAGLAARAGAQVEPLCGQVGWHVGGGEREGDQLRPLVLHRGAPVAHLRDQPGVTGAEHDPDRRGAARLDVVVAAQVVDGEQPGPRDHVHPRRLVVGGQQGCQLGVDGVGRGPAVAEQRRPQRGDDPLGVAVPHRQRRGSPTLGHHRVAPLLERALAEPAHDGVDEAAGPGAGHHLGQTHRLVGGRVRGDPHAEQLVGPQAQHVEHLRVDAVGRSAGGLDDDGVVEALPADGAEGELGGEGGIPGLEPVAAQDGGHLEVGVGPVVDGPQQRVGGEPGGLGPAGALGGRGDAALPRATAAVGAAAAGAGAAAVVVLSHRGALLVRCGCRGPSRRPPSASCRSGRPRRARPGSSRCRPAPPAW